jgi:hypothetical protein
MQSSSASSIPIQDAMQFARGSGPRDVAPHDLFVRQWAAEDVGIVVHILTQSGAC